MGITEIAAIFAVGMLTEMRVKMGKMHSAMHVLSENCPNLKIKTAAGAVAGCVASAILLLVMLASCAVPVRCYPPVNAQGEPTPLPVVPKMPNGAPVEPGAPDWIINAALAAAGLALGVPVGRKTIKKKD